MSGLAASTASDDKAMLFKYLVAGATGAGLYYAQNPTSSSQYVLTAGVAHTAVSVVGNIASGLASSDTKVVPWAPLIELGACAAGGYAMSYQQMANPNGSIGAPMDWAGRSVAAQLAGNIVSNGFNFSDYADSLIAPFKGAASAVSSQL